MIAERFIFVCSLFGNNFGPMLALLTKIKERSPNSASVAFDDGGRRNVHIINQNQLVSGFPGWVPTPVQRYLKHVEHGLSLRDVARVEGCHPSTVLRQVRRFENRRDDPLIDEALDGLGALMRRPTCSEIKKGKQNMNAFARPQALPDEETLAREARRILRRLCESGAVLALAPEMGKAAVLRSRPDAEPVRTAVVDRDIAQAFALKDWISCAGAGRVARYSITTAGRAALKRYLAEDMNSRKAREQGDPFQDQHMVWEEKSITDPNKPEQTLTVRCNVAESPLTMLGRRKDRDGKPFLDTDLVQAGERFREDFELAHMGPRVAQNWDRFMTTGDRGAFGSGAGIGEGPRAARARILTALNELGPGLGDIIMRCCCFLEGLEAAEKRMGWSARSGKVVLRIALQRLRRHYVERHGSVSALIGD
ncbi:DUF6456 domain-containing protein [uncultured Litoreibacter sp.]|uniref:DUF6456 domain-containing protein n=1 Tax=uncultured Litoreibacter sp. TaxID=1392394 RepID=UPI00261BBF7E|nr:DUF6456 domain-containing protein [uncultured Litoreibacter sp.]